MNINLAQKTVIVTGGSGGIGRVLLAHFAAEGANVVSASRNYQISQELAEDAQRQGLKGKIIPVQCDVTDRQSVLEMVAKVHELAGPVDVLINNAGGAANVGNFEDLNDDTRRVDIALNIDGVTYCTQAVATDLMQRGGNVVSISSSSAFRGSPGFVHYGAVKGYINSLTRALAIEWGPKGVRVNTIVPGLTVPHSSDAMAPSSFWNRFGDVFGTPEALQQGLEADALPFMADTPIKRLGRPEDIASAALFLASDAASFITGQTLFVNGGAYI